MLKPVFVRHDKVLKRVHPEEVVCLSTEGNYTEIFLSNDTHYLVRSTLNGALKKLPPGLFIKIHRSYAISVFHIDTIYRDHVEIKEVPVPVGRQYYKAFIDKLDIIE